MVEISEATTKLPKAMEYVYNTFIVPHLKGEYKDLIDFSPKGNSDNYIDDEKGTVWDKKHPATGKLFLKDYPNCKEAWVLVEFEYNDSSYNKVNYKSPTQRITIKDKETFNKFFGNYPSDDFDFTEDMVITVTWDNETKKRYKKLSLQETAPNFYMYVNHLKSNVEEVISRLEKIKKIVDVTGNENNIHVQIPYSLTKVGK